jgi:hypothetical protein
VSRAAGRAAAAAVLSTAVVATFAEALFGAGTFYQRDILAYWYPGMAAFRRALAEGALPLWSPHFGFGVPLLADASFQLAYPPTWLALVLPLPVQYELFVAGHALWAALGAALLARRLGCGRVAATSAAVAFSLSGPVLSAASLFHHYAGAAWMPWVLAALARALRRPGLRSSLALALAAGAQLLAGSGDACLVTGALGAAAIVFALASRPPRGREALRLAGTGLVAAFLAAGLGAVQWLPTLAQARAGGRPVQGGAAAYWSLHPLSLADLAVPRLLADAPLSGVARGALFEGRAPLLACVYLGVVTLALAALALASRSRAATLAGCGAVFFLLASLGRHTAAWALVSALPGFALMRYPQKHLLPFALCLSLLAGLGVERWLAPWPAEARRVGRRVALAGLGAALLVAAAAWALASLGTPLAGMLAADALDAGLAAAGLRVSRTAALVAAASLALGWRSTRETAPLALTAALLAIGALDLLLVGRTVNPLAPAELTSRQPAVVPLLLPFADESRIYASARDPRCARVAGGEGWEPSPAAAAAAQEALQPPAGARFGLYGSYDGVFTGIEPLYSRDLIAAAARFTGTPLGEKLMQLGSVGHVLYAGPSPPAYLQPVASVATGWTCPLHVLRVAEPLPRAYLAWVERPLLAGDNGLATLFGPGFDRRRDVALVEPLALGGSVGRGTARVAWRRSDAVLVEAELDGAAVLVLTEAYDPGWRASVDGAPVPVLRANVIFRGVRLGPGRHRVLFEYRPASFAIGSRLALLAAVALAALAALAARRSPLNTPAADGSIPSPEVRG